MTFIKKYYIAFLVLTFIFLVESFDGVGFYIWLSFLIPPIYIYLYKPFMGGYNKENSSLDKDAQEIIDSYSFTVKMADDDEIAELEASEENIAHEKYVYDEMFPVQAKLILKYKNSKQEYSERTVIATKYWRSNGSQYVHTTKPEKTFKFDRIETVADVKTGEVINDLYAYLNKKRID